ncbi:MAG: glycogen/starch synthase [Proteobacteria bacterium]|nr:glycogen/starch synthase [Pseudomonadota bacterium]MBU1688506.1 glycogen/starch synthase [Pseudomonadota bacterium]
MLTREYDGLAGAGGVKDVSRQLAEALARRGKKVSVIMPLYGFMDPKALSFRLTELGFDVDMNYVGNDRRESVRIWKARLNKVTVLFVDAQRYREKRGIYTYSAEEASENPGHRQGASHYDYFAMNVLLQKAAIGVMILSGEKPDVIHCHDGHTALVPAMIREIEGYRHFFRHTGCVVTIHNAGWGYHQEVADLPFVEALTGLPARIVRANQLEGKFDPFLAASAYCVMNTVSENYARELRETDDDRLTGWLGHQLLLRGVVLQGVTNGIDPIRFDPSRPQKMGLAAGFSPAEEDLSGKAICRKDLVDELLDRCPSGVVQTGWLDTAPGQPLLTFIGRFSEQKGMDKLIGALEILLPMDELVQVVILGSGSVEIEHALVALAEDQRFQGRICLLRGYDQALALRIYAAGDFFLVPSQYEPCGLTDLIAQLFGNLPIVHHIGGLVKVVDGDTGFTYLEHSSVALLDAMLKALQVYRTDPGKMKAMRRAAVEKILDRYSWDTVMEQYLALYRQAMPDRTGQTKLSQTISI